jgi:hypothetical protein
MRNRNYSFKIYEMIEKIGTNAGKVWTLLDEAGTQNVKDLKKSSKLTDKDLYAALGWLAREGKVALVEDEKELFVSLV